MEMHMYILYIVCMYAPGTSASGANYTGHTLSHHHIWSLTCALCVKSSQVRYRRLVKSPVNRSH